MTYSAAEIIGKNLIARRQVSITREPGGVSVFTVNPGMNVGNVWSYIQRGGVLYWMFFDDNNRPYYVAHEIGAFDVRHLQDQGALSVEEKKKLEEEKNKSFGEKLLNKGTLLAAFFIVGYFVTKNR